MNVVPEIVTDGTTVWVNTSVCLGRFGPRGVDVHRSADEQVSGLPQCLDCRHEPDWTAFVCSMRLHHAVEIPDDLEPGWSRQVRRTTC